MESKEATKENKTQLIQIEFEKNVFEIMEGRYLYFREQSIRYTDIKTGVIKHLRLPKVVIAEVRELMSNNRNVSWLSIPVKIKGEEISIISNGEPVDKKEKGIIWRTKICNENRYNDVEIRSVDETIDIKYHHYIYCLKLYSLNRLYEMTEVLDGHNSEMTIDHKDNDKNNNSISNLEIVSREYNGRKGRMYQLGREMYIPNEEKRRKDVA